MPEPDDDALPAPRAPISYFGGALLVFATTASLLAGNELEAAVVGHHDGTTASATWGWACDTANPEHRVTVVLTRARRWRPDGNRYRDGRSDRGRTSPTRRRAASRPTPTTASSSRTIRRASWTVDRTTSTRTPGCPTAALRLLSASPHEPFAGTQLGNLGSGANQRSLADRLILTRQRRVPASPCCSTPGLDAQCWLSVPTICRWRRKPFRRRMPDVPDAYRLERGELRDGSFDTPNFWVVTTNSEPAYLTPSTRGRRIRPTAVSRPAPACTRCAEIPDSESAASSPKMRI